MWYQHYEYNEPEVQIVDCLHLVTFADGNAITVTNYTWAFTNNYCVVTVETDRPANYYHWFIDGSWVNRTRVDHFGFYVNDGEPIDVECYPVDTDSWNPFEVAERGRWSPYHLIEFIRPDDDVDYYTLEVAYASAPTTWTEFARITDDNSWSYQVRTPRLTDLEEYADIRITPYRNDNAGSTLTKRINMIVRKPDPIDFAVALDENQKVTFSVS